MRDLPILPSRVSRRSTAAGTFPSSPPLRLPLLAAALALLTAVAAPAAESLDAQETAGDSIRRPIPAPVVAPGFFQRAVEAGTRTGEGRPGDAYWTQWSSYDIDARLEPSSGLITGAETIRYRNRSPDTLRVLVLNLYQNLHKEGSVRNEAAEITGGVDLDRVVVNGETLHRRGLGPGPSYEVSSTLLVLHPPEPVAPGTTTEIEVDWSFRMPQSGAGRIGWSEREIYFVGYWFPKMAVYDDLRGWDAQPYMGNAEFYDGFADYDVSLTVPGGWSVMATGSLRNPDQVYTPQTQRRIEAASRADSIVVVAGDEDRSRGRVTTRSESGWLTYRFQADSVRDFAWTTSDVQRWSATSARVPDRDGDGAEDRVLIHSFWRPDRAPLWEEQALYGKHAIEHHSRYTGFAYPWPHMTSVEGADIIGGGMEFPMMTVMGSYTGRRPQDLYNVTSHEIAHMWIPMAVSTNERRHAWMDEGSTTFLEDQGAPEYWPEMNSHERERRSYVSVARAGLEQPMMRHGDYYEPGPGYGVASYPKPATLLVTLRSLLGEEAFLEGYRGFMADWAYKHPTPWDFFNAFERAANRELDWFWRPFYYETWTLDHAVAGVESAGGRAVVVVEDRGWAILPARVRVTTSDGEALERTVEVERWLGGHRRARIPLGVAVGDVTRVEVNPSGVFPDVDPGNDVWQRE